MIYTIIDVETSGKSNKITEISVFKYDGTQVIDEFTSLVNPEVYIPDYITSLTGIDNATVADAPTFAEVANDILAITEGTTFVAHNVNFDYNVIRNEFKALGIDFNRKKLCTVRLSRKLLPGHKSYSLGKLCKSLDITIVDRHRARGDAEATVILFEILLNQEAADKVFSDFLKKSSKEATLPSHLPTAVFNKLPNSAGIYYFKNKKGEIIYIGKAKDIKKRVLSHFYSKAQKSLDLCRNTANIDFELSGSELIALLMEDAAIKQHYPEYNVISKRAPKAYAIFIYEDRLVLKHLAYNTLKSTPNSIQTFSSITDCRQYLEKMCAQFELCPKFCHLQDSVVQCSHYKITTCKGVCANHESVTDYNLRVTSAIDYINNNKENVVLKQKGRHNQEEAFVLIKDNIYLGYGFIDKSEQINNPEDLETFLIPQKENFDVWKILRSVLK